MVDYPSKLEWIDYVIRKMKEMAVELDLDNIYLDRLTALIQEDNVTFSTILRLCSDMFDEDKDSLIRSRNDILPFLAESGAYGINTYLYLFSYGLYAVRHR